MDNQLQIPEFPQALTWPEKARGIAIIDQASYEVAAGMKLDMTAMRKKIVEEFAPMKDAAFKAHRAITAKEAEYLAPITDAENILKASIVAFQREQERLRQEEQRRLDAERMRLEEEDRQRRMAEARAAQAAEAARIAEIRAREEAERLANATTFEDLDKPVFAVPELPPVEAFIAPPAPIAAAVAAPTFEKAKGLGIRTTWECRVISVRQLAKAVADGMVPESYILANTTALNARARSDKNEMRIPGCVAVEK